jgi:hypothetical protein
VTSFYFSFHYVSFCFCKLLGAFFYFYIVFVFECIFIFISVFQKRNLIVLAFISVFITEISLTATIEKLTVQCSELFLQHALKPRLRLRRSIKLKICNKNLFRIALGPLTSRQTLSAVFFKFCLTYDDFCCTFGH